MSTMILSIPGNDEKGPSLTTSAMLMRQVKAVDPAPSGARATS